jgi:hypothetical protein
MVQILCMRKWPNCANLVDKRTLPQPKPVSKLEPEPEPKLQQATSIQKLPKPELGPKENKPKVVTPDSVLDLAEEASKMHEAVPKRERIILDPSSFSEDTPVPEQKATEAKQEEPCKGLDKAYVAHIREALRKRKHTEDISHTVGKAQLDSSSKGLDDWIEKELESGIIVGSKPVCHKTRAEQRTQVMPLNTSRGYDDSWIEKELEEGIIVDSKPVNRNKVKSTGGSGAKFKLEKCGALKALMEHKRENEARVNLSSKRQCR